MTDTAELVKRLRHCAAMGVKPFAGDLLDAADTITRLQGEVDALRARLAQEQPSPTPSSSPAPNAG